MKPVFLVLFCIVCSISLLAQPPKEKGLAAITKSAVQGQLEFLASDWTEGRAAGTKGEYMAADYIASMFKVYGLEPYGDETFGGMGRRGFSSGGGSGFRGMGTRAKTYFQNINMVEYKPGPVQKFSVITSSTGSESSVDFNFRTDFSVRPGNVGISVKAPLVFVGYGFTDEKNGYDDYKKLDVKGKIVLMLSGYPGYRDENSAAYKKFTPEDRRAQFAIERGKTTKAEKLGAVGIIQIRPGSDPSAEWSDNQIYPVKGTFYEADVPMKSPYEGRMALPEDTLSGSIPVFTVTSRVINHIMTGSGIDFAAYEKNVAEKMIPASMILPGKSVSFQTTVESRIVKVRNVLGYLEGEKKDEIMVIGGHYDHMGKTDGWVCNGADDNASGTVGVMTLAKAFTSTGKKPQKSIVFAAWTAEEKGLLGSEYFVKKFPKDKKVVLDLNYDMIARNVATDSLGNMADMMYTETYKGIKEATEKNMADYKINLKLSYKKPGGGSDNVPFGEAGVPVFYFMAAMHPDYHQPSDEVSKVNWDKMTNIIRIGFLNAWDFANGDEYLKPEPEKK